MEKLCDLHAHSIFSDGTDTPGRLLALAVQAGLSAVALTDHNTADGLPEFAAEAERFPVEAVPGVEFSVDLDGTELHLLALYLPREYFSQVAALMDAYNRRKEESNLSLVDALDRAGYQLSYEAIRAATPHGHINRSHLAAELTRLGYTESVKDAFRRLLSPEAGFYVPPRRLSIWETIDFIRSVNAVPVLAHPFLQLDLQGLQQLLPQAKQRGLLGMECFYSTYDPQTTQLSLELADAFGLLPSGGSDYHGTTKPDIRLGAGKGSLRIPLSWAENIREAAQTHRR